MKPKKKETKKKKGTNQYNKTSRDQKAEMQFRTHNNVNSLLQAQDP